MMMVCDASGMPLKRGDLVAIPHIWGRYHNPPDFSEAVKGWRVTGIFARYDSVQVARGATHTVLPSRLMMTYQPTRRRGRASSH